MILVQRVLLLQEGAAKGGLSPTHGLVWWRGKPPLHNLKPKQQVKVLRGSASMGKCGHVGHPWRLPCALDGRTLGHAPVLDFEAGFPAC